MKNVVASRILLMSLGLALLAGATPSVAGDSLHAPASLAQMVERFVPFEITASTAGLSEANKKALAKILEAAKLMDPIFLRQVWSKNAELEKKLVTDSSREGRRRLHYFRINQGPWSRLDENEPFLDGVPKVKPPGAAYYPEDMTKEEFDAWVKGLSEAERAKATGYFHVIRRGPDGKLRAVPYSEEYREFLAPAAKLLLEAAELTDNASLKKYLTTRAADFLGNDYYASDVAWMELDSPIEPSIGPYETYEDTLLGYKAAFEAYVTIRDDAETTRLSKFATYLQELEDHLPFEPKYRNPKIGSGAPIRVVLEVFVSGDANRGYQVSAFNLPNDERVVREKGSKRVMIRNVQEAKFDRILVPIAKKLLAPDARGKLNFEAFFTFVLAHELVHGIGPQQITVNGQKTTPRQELRELYSAMEEAKADITGLWAMLYLADKGVVGPELSRTLFPTFLASCFRSLRYGLNEAHGKAIAVQFNFLRDKGAFLYDEKSGTFAIDEKQVRPAVTDLAGQILTIEAEGSYQKGKALFDKYAVMRPEVTQAIRRVSEIPVDIDPKFPLAR
ncbi:MAG: hypothetical protein HY814_02335 [Candidatus Riflebacteria bacterium]|nr:hypothetical protein [Candidatus Riflebacteria bacterium]